MSTREAIERELAMLGKVLEQEQTEILQRKKEQDAAEERCARHATKIELLKLELRRLEPLGAYARKLLASLLPGPQRIAPERRARGRGEYHGTREGRLCIELEKLGFVTITSHLEPMQPFYERKWRVTITDEGRAKCAQETTKKGKR